MNAIETFLTIFGLGLLFIMIGVQSFSLIPILALGVVLTIGSFILFLPIIPVRKIERN